MPVIAEVPLPWRRPVRVEAPVPPFATVKSFVRLSVSIHAVVEVKRVDVALLNTFNPLQVLLVVVPKASPIVPEVVIVPPVMG